MAARRGNSHRRHADRTDAKLTGVHGLVVTTDVTLLRSLWQGRVRGQYSAYRTRTQDEELRVLYLPNGTRYTRAAPGGGPTSKLDGSWTTVERVYPSRSLIVHRPGQWCSVWLMWTAGGEFHGWYANFEEPWRERVDGYETVDMALDIVVDADRTWQWKDRGEFDELVAAGAVTRSAADEVLREGDRVVAEIEAAAGVFGGAWPSWAPPDLRPPSV
jgi:predicted RNA-binding protein associated with RNAse of E/G family